MRGIGVRWSGGGVRWSGGGDDKMNSVFGHATWERLPCLHKSVVASTKKQEVECLTDAVQKAMIGTQNQ